MNAICFQCIEQTLRWTLRITRCKSINKTPEWFFNNLDAFANSQRSRGLGRQHDAHGVSLDGPRMQKVTSMGLRCLAVIRPQKSDLHVPPFSGTWALTASVATLVFSTGLTISSVSFWPFPAICEDFFISFDDVRCCDLFGLLVTLKSNRWTSIGAKHRTILIISILNSETACVLLSNSNVAAYLNIRDVNISERLLSLTLAIRSISSQLFI
jgi:hypothetical protein